MRTATTIRLTPDMNPRIDSISAPIDVVWGRLQRTYAALGIPVTTVDPKNHTLGAIRAQVRGRLGHHRMADLLECGNEPTGGQRADSYAISLTAITELTTIGSNTQSRTVVNATSRDPNGTSGDVQCGSKNVIEADIATALAKP